MDQSQYVNKRLNYIHSKSMQRLNILENNINELKDAFHQLTKEYEAKKIIQEQELQKLPKIDINPLTEIIVQLIAEEREANINNINEALKKYNSVDCIDSYKEQTAMKEIITNIEKDIKNVIKSLNDKEDNVKKEKDNNINTINDEMKNELNNLHKKVNDTNLDLIISNSDKANAIQDIIKIYMNKFKALKSEFNEFEDKVSKLIYELLDKVVLIKKGKNSNGY